MLGYDGGVPEDAVIYRNQTPRIISKFESSNPSFEIHTSKSHLKNLQDRYGYVRRQRHFWTPVEENISNITPQKYGDLKKSRNQGSLKRGDIENVSKTSKNLHQLIFNESRTYEPSGLDTKDIQLEENYAVSAYKNRDLSPDRLDDSQHQLKQQNLSHLTSVHSQKY